MGKARRIIVGIVSVIYLTLVIMKIDIPRNVFIALTGIMLISGAIDEWNRYKETKKENTFTYSNYSIAYCYFCSLEFIVLIEYQ